MRPFGLLMIWLLMVACGDRHALRQPEIETPDLYAPSNGVAVAEWCSRWDVPELRALLRRGFAGNPGLAQALARLRAAEAQARIAGSNLWPQVDAAVQAGRGKQEVMSPFGTIAVTEDRYRASLHAAYEIDLWGRLAASHDAAALQAAARHADLRSAHISLGLRIASSWLRHIAWSQQRAIAQEQLRVSQHLERLLRLQFGQGLANAQQLAEAVAGAEAARSEVLRLQAAAEQERLLLAQLLACEPHTLDLQRESLPPLPPVPAAGPPAVLLTRRPDLQAAAHRVAASDLRVDARLADRWPRLRLEAELFTTASQPAGLADRILWQIFGSLVQPLIDGDRLKARAEQAQAEAYGALQAYREAVLQALREVADALIVERSRRQRLDMLQAQLEQRERQVHWQHMQFANGGTTLNAQLQQEFQLLRLRQQHIDLHAQVLEIRLALYRRLGGDWTDDSGDDAE